VRVSTWVWDKSVGFTQHGWPKACPRFMGKSLGALFGKSMHEAFFHALGAWCLYPGPNI